MPDLNVEVRNASTGWVAQVTVRGDTTSTHRVSVSPEELARFGGGDVTELVRRSFEFLLEREPNTSILATFDLGTIERYFPEYVKEIAG